MKNDAQHALAFRALAHPRRMRLFRLLAQHRENGRSVATLQTAARIPEASFRHHLQEMEKAGLVRRHRRGREVGIHLTPTSLRLAMGIVDQLIGPIRPERAAA